MEEMLEHPVVHMEDDGLRFITLRTEPLENPLNRVAKRVLDFLVSLPVVVLVLPPLVYACLAAAWILRLVHEGLTD